MDADQVHIGVYNKLTWLIPFWSRRFRIKRNTHYTKCKIHTIHRYRVLVRIKLQESLRDVFALLEFILSFSPHVYYICSQYVPIILYFIPLHADNTLVCGWISENVKHITMHVVPRNHVFNISQSFWSNCFKITICWRNASLLTILGVYIMNKWMEVFEWNRKYSLLNF